VSITKAGLRTRALQLADAVSSPRWDNTATTGEVDLHMGNIHIREWRRLLNASPFYRVAVRTPAIDSSSRIAITDLSSGAGDSVQTLYRVIEVVVDNSPLKEIDPRDGLMSTLANATIDAGVYFRQGNYIICPGHPSVTATGVFVNYTPTPANALSNENITVDWPEGYELVLAYEIAAAILSKGAAEIDATAACKAFAEDYRRDMLQDLARLSTSPMQLRYPDTAAEWAG
jgi:hypothetical protein